MSISIGGDLVVCKIFPNWFAKIKFNYGAILNIVECEAHNELFIAGLKGKLEEKAGGKNK